MYLFIYHTSVRSTIYCIIIMALPKRSSLIQNVMIFNPEITALTLTTSLGWGGTKEFIPYTRVLVALLHTLLDLYPWIKFKFTYPLHCNNALFCFMAYQQLLFILIPIPVFTYILNISFVNTFCRYTQLNYQTVLFGTI